MYCVYSNDDGMYIAHRTQYLIRDEYVEAMKQICISLSLDYYVSISFACFVCTTQCVCVCLFVSKHMCTLRVHQVIHLSSSARIFTFDLESHFESLLLYHLPLLISQEE